MSVEVRGGLIKEEDLSILFQEGSCNQDPLSLASREFASEIPDLGLVSIFHLHDLVMDLALPGNFIDLLKRGLWVAILEVEQHGIVEKYAILGDHTDILAIGLESQVLQVLSIDTDLSLSWVVDAINHVQHGGLSEPRVPHDCIRGACLDV